jgi:hypothetical protein
MPDQRYAGPVLGSGSKMSDEDEKDGDEEEY